MNTVANTTQPVAGHHALLLMLVVLACIFAKPAQCSSRWLTYDVATAAEDATQRAAGHTAQDTSCGTLQQAQDCEAKGMVCVNNICTDCTKSSECKADRRYCVVGRCRAKCTSDSQCKTLKPSAASTKYCVAGNCIADMCRVDAHCRNRTKGATPFCVALPNGRGRTCRQCRDDQGCAQIQDKHACNTKTGKCVQCMEKSDCVNPAAAGGLANTLGPAVAPNIMVCDTNLSLCKLVPSDITPINVTVMQLNCTSNEDCPKVPFMGVVQQVCNASDTASGVCVECTNSSDCAAGVTCNDQGMCMECSTNEDCAQQQASVVCNTAISKCVQCNVDDDCRLVFVPTMSPAKCWQGVCASCTDDSHCAAKAGLEGLGPYCVDGDCKTTGRTCTNNEQCQHSAKCPALPEEKCPTPVCDTNSSVCDSRILGGL